MSLGSSARPPGLTWLRQKLTLGCASALTSGRRRPSHWLLTAVQGCFPGPQGRVQRAQGTGLRPGGRFSVQIERLKP